MIKRCKPQCFNNDIIVVVTEAAACDYSISLCYCFVGIVVCKYPLVKLFDTRQRRAIVEKHLKESERFHVPPWHDEA